MWELKITTSKWWIDEAMIDLDINGDGMIDFYEFKRWYFAGFRPYSKEKRRYMTFAKNVVTLVDFMKRDKVKELLSKEIKIRK